MSQCFGEGAAVGFVWCACIVACWMVGLGISAGLAEKKRRGKSEATNEALRQDGVEL